MVILIKYRIYILFDNISADFIISFDICGLTVTYNPQISIMKLAVFKSKKQKQKLLAENEANQFSIYPKSWSSMMSHKFEYSLQAVLVINDVTQVWTSSASCFVCQ